MFMYILVGTDWCCQQSKEDFFTKTLKTNENLIVRKTQHHAKHFVVSLGAQINRGADAVLGSIGPRQL